MPGTLVFGSLEAVAAAHALQRGPVSGALIGAGSAALVERFAHAGLDALFVADEPSLAPYRAATHVAVASDIVARSGADLVLFPHTDETAEWVPLLAGRMRAALATGCTRLSTEQGTLIATRSVCGGAALGDYAFARPLCFATLAPGATAEAATSHAACPVTRVSISDADTRVEVLEELREEVGAGPSLKQAKTVVSGGLGLGARENWHLVEETAAVLGAAVGATRAVVELGWVPSALQVGFSGQKIGPDLYIAVGISGAVHHLAGIAAAKTIVAINKDAEAPIFRAARFGVVGDAKEIVPAFIARVKELRARQG